MEIYPGDLADIHNFAKIYCSVKATKNFAELKSMASHKNYHRGPRSQMGPGMMYDRSNNFYIQDPDVWYRTSSSFNKNLSKMAYPSSDQIETSYIYIPNSGVSAIIGTRGSQIKHMMKMSGTRIIIPPVEKKVAASTSKRKVTIVGPPHCHYRAQFFIFNKMVSDGFLTGLDAPLEIELSVPSDLVGTIIGRQGQVVRELQLQTGVVIKIPKQSETNSSEETPIHIIGSYFSTVAAQVEIRSILSNALVRRNFRQK